MKKINPAQFAKTISDGQTVNAAGGTVYKIDDWARLDRYLILGSESGTYYVNANKFTLDNVKSVISCIEKDGIRVVKRTVEISDQGLAPKNDQAIFVLALCLTKGDKATKAFVRSVFNSVVRTASHLTMFVDFANQIRGWGRALRSVVSDWYLQNGSDPDRNISNLVYQTMKYANRNGFTQRDILRLCHVKPKNVLQSTLFNWITNPDNIPVLPNKENESLLKEISEDLYKYAVAKNLSSFDKEKIIDYVLKYSLPHEVIPSVMKNEPEIWQALFDAGMPLNALIRNLGKMSSLNLFPNSGINTENVINIFNNDEYIEKSRIHPINVLNQMEGYRRGVGRSGLKWCPNKRILDAFESMFYKSFKNVEPTGKRYLLGLDISGSMSWNFIQSMALNASQVSVAMAMTTLRTEEQCAIFGFADHIIGLNITKESSLKQALKATECPFGSTDCSALIRFAIKNKIAVDSFIIYTDNETWCGEKNGPARSLWKYREISGIPAKLIVVACTATDYSIADPNDPGMLDIAGFSSAVPQVISYFSSKN